MGSGVDKRTVARTIYHVLLGLAELATVRMRSERGGYDLVPANRELAGAEVELVELQARETRLKVALERVVGDYDFILIDCPPSLSLLTVNALTAAQRVLIPMQCEYYALEGLSDLVGTIKRVRAHLNPELEIAGLLRTMYDRGTRYRSRSHSSWKRISATRSTARSCRATCAGRGTELRRAGSALGRRIEGRAGLPRAR